MTIVDAHLDLAYNVGRGRDVRQPAAQQPIAENEIATVGLPDLRAGKITLICATIFCMPRIGNKPGYTNAAEAAEQAKKQYDWYQKQWDADELKLVRSASELPQPSPETKKKGDDMFAWVREPEPPKKSAIPMLLLMEGADAMESPRDVGKWFDKGVRIMGLAWRRTRMAGGTGEPGPLTDEGRDVVKAMDQVGMIHDMSHLAEEAFWQLLEMTQKPVIASHSNCRSIVPTDRQLSDPMIRAIIERRGVIGMNFYDKFLMNPADYGKRRCELRDMIAHIQHICDLAGSAQYAALGSDMDGGLGREQIPREIETIADLHRIADALAAAGFTDVDVHAIMGENWLLFFKQNLPA
ncbi:MAG TPA: membrane dipeptidase [Tepidisphaeraceae bacterium]|jgi:membrane dipeptidase